MKTKSFAAILALVAALFMPLPASASGLLCETDSVTNPYCYLASADISNDAKFIFGVEAARGGESESGASHYDDSFTTRIVMIEVATQKVTELVGWTAPETKISEMPIGDKFVHSSWGAVDLSPDGKFLLLRPTLLQIELLARGPEFYAGADIKLDVVGSEILVLDLKTKKLTNLSETLGLKTPYEVDGIQQYPSLSNPTWSSNSKEIRFLKADQRDFTNHSVAVAAPTKLKSYRHNVRFASAGSRFGAIENPVRSKGFMLFDLRKNRRVGEIRGTTNFSDYQFDAVLPKDSGKAFFATAYQDLDTGQNQVLFQIDSKGKRKVIFPQSSELGLVDIRYAEKGKRLLIQTATKGFALIRG